MLTGLFMLWTLFTIWQRGFRSHAADFRYSWKEKFQSIPKIAPFLAIIVGVMYVLYGGVATPSEAAGVGAALCVVLAVVIYRMWQPQAVVGDPARHHARVGDDPDDHRRRGAVRLHADFALPHADAGAGDRRDARQPLGADGADQPLPAGVRLLHSAGGDHPDDQRRSCCRSSPPRASTRCGSASSSRSTWRSASSTRRSASTSTSSSRSRRTCR